ncbi:DUF3037 domain-containing protein [Actinokineospora sp. NBRC 105648]|uniref:DUF3037 domain-containing protein n=1 Tax=Actinokineospora sp. NBRC 105648 TaxID=3032206 RepID=UPI0024A0C21F|nr:DUF3037 domain-containing protein [Actinokineospora sp. NBRC 105648]GLZ39745.1 hypothetical protein Acsp05_33690 [Actinokineospora sp. NBRC 105648]
MPHVFEYALLRAVPRQDRGEAMNVGVLLYCAPLDYLRCRTHVDKERLLALDASLDLSVLADTLGLLCGACDGSANAAPVTGISVGQRFRWLTAPRSTLVQTSPTHTGLTTDPDADLDRLFRRLVLPLDS